MKEEVGKAMTLFVPGSSASSGVTSGKMECTWVVLIVTPGKSLLGLPRSTKKILAAELCHSYNTLPSHDRSDLLLRWRNISST